MKKQIGLFTAILFAVSTLMMACKAEVHTHTFAEEWTKDETNHWHASTCGHDITEGKTAHTFGGWITTKEATCTENGERKTTCTICGYEKTEVTDKAEHTFGDWTVTKAATEEAEGSRERSCSVCEYTATEAIEKLAHTHKFASEWTSNETYHWHAATCEHATEVSGKAEHSFGEWTVTKEATEEAEGTKESSCTVCGYKATEAIEKLAHTHTFASEWTSDETNHWHAATCEHTTEVSGKAKHSFGAWTTTKAATEEAEGTRERNCSVCGYTATEAIEKLAHTHKFATDWTKDETYHWYASTCGHDVTEGKTAHTFCDWKTTKEATCTENGERRTTCAICGYKKTEVTDKKEHSFGIWETTKDPTETEVGQMKKKCKVCGETVTKELQPAPEGYRFVEGVTITGTESWTPSSNVFLRGRSLTIQDLIVSDHEVTRGEYKDVMGKDPSKASAYDKEGNKLEGEDVLNNPVNYVNWYAAIAYCNKLSLKEKLTPCYSVSGVTDWEKLAYNSIPTSSNNSTWNAATCNFEADGYRLPTEAEWEWLARGGENYFYAGSNTVGDVAWYTSNTNDTGTREVKTKTPNGYRLYDMSGNVSEWCWDWHGSISDSTTANGATSGNYRVLRGGDWRKYDDYFCLVFFPSYNGPICSADSCGFRVVRASSN